METGGLVIIPCGALDFDGLKDVNVAEGRVVHGAELGAAVDLACDVEPGRVAGEGDEVADEAGG